MDENVDLVIWATYKTVWMRMFVSSNYYLEVADSSIIILTLELKYFVL